MRSRWRRRSPSHLLCNRAAKSIDLLLKVPAFGRIRLPFEGFIVNGGGDITAILAFVIWTKVITHHESRKPRSGEREKSGGGQTPQFTCVVRLQPRAKIGEHQTIGLRKVRTLFLDEIEF